MIYGTAGMTAVACVDALQHHGIGPDGEGEILVTGATGGVGSIAVMLLKKLGYQVAALTGKPGQTEVLQQWGAGRVVIRGEWQDESDKPLLRGQWRGGIDVAGGATLSQVLRETASQGTVAACGMVGGADLPVTVLPVHLAGSHPGWDRFGRNGSCYQISLLGQSRYWDLLAGPWNLDWPPGYVQETPLAEMAGQVKKMLASETVGRMIVQIPG